MAHPQSKLAEWPTLNRPQVAYFEVTGDTLGSSVQPIAHRQTQAMAATSDADRGGALATRGGHISPLFITFSSADG